MKTLLILIAAVTFAASAQANRTVCKRDYFDPSKTVCETEGGSGGYGTRTVCRRDYFDPSKTVCEQQ